MKHLRFSRGFLGAMVLGSVLTMTPLCFVDRVGRSNQAPMLSTQSGDVSAASMRFGAIVNKPDGGSFYFVPLRLKSGRGAG